MIIRRIELTNFKNFKGKHSFDFTNYNLLSGTNGAGKSTLGLDSILFCLYGHSGQNIDRLKTREVTGATQIAIEVDNLKVIRKIPTDLSIYKDGELMEFPTNREAQKYLNERYKNVDYFRKFRMIDITKGINILEQGNKEILKTLFQYHQEYLNSIRQALLDKKTERDKYNVDNIVTHKHYPSQARYDFLKTEINNYSDMSSKVSRAKNIAQKEYYSLISQKKSLDNERNDLTTKSNSVNESSVCPICRTTLNVKVKTEVSGDYKKRALLLQAQSATYIDKINQALKETKEHETKEQSLTKRYQRLVNLKEKLDTRLKQKDFIYTTKDVEVLKTAVKELDKFSSSYIVKYVGSLEPIINDVLKIIGFEVHFLVGKKGEVSLELTKEGISYDYFDLSSGQKLLLTVGFQLALLLEKGEEGIIIADEGFSSLTEENLNLLLDMIKQYPFQLIYIIHRSNSVPEGIQEIKL